MRRWLTWVQSSVHPPMRECMCGLVMCSVYIGISMYSQSTLTCIARSAFIVIGFDFARPRSAVDSSYILTDPYFHTSPQYTWLRFHSVTRLLLMHMPKMLLRGHPLTHIKVKTTTWRRVVGIIIDSTGKVVLLTLRRVLEDIKSVRDVRKTLLGVGIIRISIRMRFQRFFPE